MFIIFAPKINIVERAEAVSKWITKNQRAKGEF